MEKTAVNQTSGSALVESLFSAGVHYGQVRSRRHPSAKKYIFGTKEKVEIFDLEKTAASVIEAKEFISKITSQGGQILFVGGKPEARNAVIRSAQAVGMPYVANRWIGVTFTNFGEVKRRVARLETLRSEKEKGDFAKYTKRERMILDKEIENLEKYFSGIVTMRELPKALIVVDTKREHIAVEEAKKVGIPVISLSSSDCDFSKIDIAIPGNDASMAAVTLILDELTKAFTTPGAVK
jgi:small subunit ribosomal protein S2